MAYFVLDFAFLVAHFCFVKEDRDFGFEVVALLVAVAGVDWLDSALLVDFVGVLVAIVVEACCPRH